MPSHVNYRYAKYVDELWGKFGLSWQSIIGRDPVLEALCCARERGKLPLPDIDTEIEAHENAL
jgi:hypothetical protein